MDGLRVPLIVYDPDEPMDYDRDEIVSVSGKKKKDKANWIELI